MEPTKEEILTALKKAQNASIQQNFREALRNYLWVEKNIQDDPDNLPFVWMEIGWAYYALNDFNKTIEFLEKSLESSQLVPKQIVDCMRLIGFSHENLGNTDKAITYLQDALLQKVDKIDLRHIYFELGKIFFVLNTPGKARPYLEDAQELFGADDGEYLQTTKYYLGFIAFFEGDNSKAENLFNEYINDAPDTKSQAPGYFGITHILLENKKYKELINVCNKIIELDNAFYDKETLGFFLNKSYMELKMWKQLEIFLPQLIENYPEGRYKATYPQLKQALQSGESSEQTSK